MSLRPWPIFQRNSIRAAWHQCCCRLAVHIPRGVCVISRYVYFISACLGVLPLAACHSATAPTNTTTTTSTTTTPVAQAVTIGGTLAPTAVGQTSQLTATTA